MPADKTKKTNSTKPAVPRDDPSPSSPASYPEGFIPPHGGYEKLLAYRKSEIIYDATVRFCDRFIDKRSRTHDQMVQAARSGNKNIAEGSQISGTSKESEIKLTQGKRTRRVPRTDALPHWSRFAILPGLTRDGSYAPPHWLTRHE